MLNSFATQVTVKQVLSEIHKVIPVLKTRKNDSIGKQAKNMKWQHRRGHANKGQ